MSAGTDWTDRNHRFVLRELRWLVARLSGDGAPTRARPPARITPPAAIDVLVDSFSLSNFERALLLLCAGVELDAEVAAAVSGAARGRGPTFSLALAGLPGAHWSALSPARPLRRWRMIEPAAGHDLTTAPLRIDERVLHFIAGVNDPDPRLAHRLTRREVPAEMAAAQRELADRIARDWGRAGGVPSVFQLGGDDPQGAEDVAVAAASRLGLRLFVLSAEDAPVTAAELDEFAVLWSREAILLPAALFVQCFDGPAPPHAARLLERLNTPLFIGARDPLRLGRPALYHGVRKPDGIEQKRLWRLALNGEVPACEATLDAVAAQFRLSARAIALAAQAVRARVRAGEPAARALHAACRGGNRHRLDELATRNEPCAGWDDLVLPPAQITLLRHIAAQVRQRRRVYDDWGFARGTDRGLGVSVLFSGESGTGKTLAAEVLAADLALDLYRIDLASVVSKYIGETEKNLRRVFEAAEDSGVILLFDEADALFGKRSDVKDSHDRYANIEVAYLLQRMEAYHGLAILTTNLKAALDQSFQRRLRFIVQFPFPDAEQREAIWRRAFPRDAPTEALDFAKLARLNVAGGGVRTISLNAAFLAAEAGEPVGMRHLLAAARADRAKLDRPLSETETRGWL
jgi:hypothetical protein